MTPTNLGLALAVLPGQCGVGALPAEARVLIVRCMPATRSSLVLGSALATIAMWRIIPGEPVGTTDRLYHRRRFMYLRLTRGHVNPAHVDEAITMIPDIIAAIRALPGVQDVRVGIDHETGRTLSLITLDTAEHAQFPRERLGPAFERLLALGWGPEAAEIYEATIYETIP